MRSCPRPGGPDWLRLVAAPAAPVSKVAERRRERREEIMTEGRLVTDLQRITSSHLLSAETIGTDKERVHCTALH